MGTLSGSTGNDSLVFGDGAGADSLLGLAGDDYLDGLAGADTLSGGDGADTLAGGAGNDSLLGGGGNDLYRVDVLLDKIAPELANGGIDAVYSTAASFTLVANVENLTLGEGGSFNATGNGGNNALDGNSAGNRLDGAAGNDTLNGHGGADTLLGGAGNDLFYTDGGDSLSDSGGVDTLVISSNANVMLAGAFSAFENVILDNTTGVTVTGNAAANNLASSDGYDDVLIGAAGNDTYNVNDAGDVVTETLAGAAGGTDLVVATGIDFSLEGTQIENLTLIGAEGIGTGNAFANVMTASGEGAHTLVGGAGNDTYNIRDNDVVTEGADAAAGVADAVNATLEADDTLVVAENIERITILAAGAAGSVVVHANDSANSIAGSAHHEVLNAGGGADTVSGGAGNDVLNGGLGNDRLVGDAGNDIFTGGGGSDTLDGGAGNDSYNVEISAIAGTLSDVIVDATGTDTLYLWSTDFTLNAGVTFTLAGALENLDLGSLDETTAVHALGNGASNEIKGTGYDNRLTGAAGNDSLAGNAGADTLVGDAGNDTLQGGDGADSLIGGAGNDTYILDGDLSDTVVETAANGASDTVATSGAGTFTLGGAGNLRFIENLILAGEGGTGIGTLAANIFTSTGGSATFQGGGGSDTYNVQVDDIVTEGADTAAGAADLVNLTVYGGDEYTLAANVEHLTLVAGESAIAVLANGTAAANRMTGTAASADSLFGAAGADTIDGLAGNDYLNGEDGADSMSGGAGDDTYVIDHGSDKVNEALANGGSDTVIASVNHTLGANFEHLTIAGPTGRSGKGNAKDNILVGGGGADTIDGDAGADTLDGGAGGDSLSGGLGNDRYVESLGDDVFVIAQAGDTIDGSGGGGVDTVRVALPGHAYLDLSDKAFLEHAVFTGAGAVTIKGNDEANNLAGGAGNDTLLGGAGADTLVGGVGGDSMVGGSGNDTYFVDSPNDRMGEEAAGGIDTMVSTVAVTLPGGYTIENVTLAGTATSATGNTDANRLIGNASANTLNGGGGADTLEGGGGADVYVVDGGDTVTESLAGVAGGIDLVRTSADFILSDNVENAILTAGAAALTGNGLVNALTGGAGADTLDGMGGADTLTGGAGSDTYFVDTAADKVIEAAGAPAGTADTIVASITYSIAPLVNIENLALAGADDIHGTGGAGNNLLTGNAGANSLSGGAGADTLDGGVGNDSLIGGAGNDSYVYDAADVLFEDITGGVDLVTSDLADVVLTAANVENISLGGELDLDATGNSGANIITGNTGSNVLFGGGGADTLHGGGGNDTAVFAGSRAAYNVVISGDGYRVSGGSDGGDLLFTIERVSFADETDLDLAALATPADAPLATPTPEAALNAGASSRWSNPSSVTFSFSTVGSSEDHPEVQTPDVALQQAIRNALQLWEEVANIDFVETADSNSVGMRFGTEAAVAFYEGGEVGPDLTLGGYAYYPSTSNPTGTGLHGDVWINRNFFNYEADKADGFASGTDVFQTLLHEIGHAIGFKHSFDSTPKLTAAEENNLYTVMSYDSHPQSVLLVVTETPSGGYSWGFNDTHDVQTPMLYDVSTAQSYYGVNATTRAGNTVYGREATDPRFAFSPDAPFLLTIWDGGGVDVIDVSHFDLPSIVNLNGGAFSSIGMSDFLGYFEGEFGLLPFDFRDLIEVLEEPWPPFGRDDYYNGVDNLVIAEIAVIENAVGSTAADQLIGNQAANRLDGQGGSDTLTGGTAGDTFVFSTALNAATNVDRIEDFTSGSDAIWLDDDVFVALAGGWDEAAFTTGAIAAGDYIRYNAGTGELFYDADSNGGGAEVKFAVLTGTPALLGSDFTVVG